MISFVVDKSLGGGETCHGVVNVIARALGLFHGGGVCFSGPVVGLRSSCPLRFLCLVLGAVINFFNYVLPTSPPAYASEKLGLQKLE